MISNTKTYSPREEKLNVWSHAIGIALGLIGFILLLYKGIALKSISHIVSYVIYGVSSIILFVASTLYHSEKDTEKRKKLKVFDHVAIYFQIAGGYTPFCIIGLQGAWGWWILGMAWAIGILGMILKLFFTGRFNILSTLSYLFMGWVVVIAIKPMLNALSYETLLWLAIGGIFYTVGAILYSIKKIPYNHAIFHFFVLAGAISHYIAVYFYL